MEELLEGPDAEQMRRIRAELREDEARVGHVVRAFAKWVSCQPHLPRGAPLLDERLLAVFLRGCKHDLERAKRKLETYFLVRRTCPELYGARDPTDGRARLAADMLQVVPLPRLTRQGYRVTVNRLTRGSDASAFDMEHVVRGAVMLGDLRVRCETAVAGDVYVLDLGDRLALGYCAKAAHASLRRVFAVAHDAYPQRLHRIHVVNAPPFVDRLLTALKTFMRDKLRGRFLVHRSLDSLHEYVERAVLPTEYGGEAGPLATLHERWQRALLERRDDFLREEELLAALPPPPRDRCAPHASTEHPHGSFRALAID